MPRCRLWLSPFVTLVLTTLYVPFASGQDYEQRLTGERLDPATNGPGVVESMTEVLARDRYAARPLVKDRRGRQGAWMVPSPGAANAAHSGDKYIINRWGDTRMAIGFPEPVDVEGAYFAGQSNESAWTAGLRVVGYRDGAPVQETDWFYDICPEPTWFAMGLRDVDRIEIVAVPVLDGAGWYALDDLTYTFRLGGEAQRTQTIVVDFEDLANKTVLTGSGYADLTWEVGAGDFTAGQAIHAPQAPLEAQAAEPGEREAAVASGTRAVGPTLLSSFQGVVRGDAGSWSYPPDTDGAIGPNHYVETVNRNFAVYDKTTHVRVVNTTLDAFLPGSNGDPRVLYDQHSGRWIVTNCDFSSRVYLAVSMSNDPTGSWYKTYVTVSQGSDASRWPDYPTLGVDANGIYISAYMVGGGGMSIFAIDKAPLVSPSPSLGTVTAFRDLPWEGAIQPAHTYGNPGGQYFISVKDSNELRVRRVNPPLTAPTLDTLGTVTVTSFSQPPEAPALGSTVPLNTVDRRLMMAVYRDGSLWTAHTIAASGRAACRWYQIAVPSRTLIQSGTVADSSLHYFFPAIMVNGYGSVVMGFTGSNASQYAACYYTGRLPSDTAGQMATPVLYRPGLAAHNLIDDQGRNRWGDYSYTTLDPVNDRTFWTIQEYTHANDVWGTYVAVLGYGDGDCNSNGVPDYLDLTGGTSQDCNGNSVPDECDVAAGTSPDCNGNNVPDECDVGTTSLDCNLNGIPDECELATHDCNTNGIPDDCDIMAGTSLDCNGNWIPDNCDVAGGTSPDCNSNGVPDECDVAGGTSPDCNSNGVPDTCDLAGGTSADCNGNSNPDECDIAAGTSADCNFNGVPDVCDLAGGTSPDCNSNGVPDECDLLSQVDAQSPQLSPIGTGSPQTYTLYDPPTAYGPVTLSFQAYGDFNFDSEKVDVYLNSTWIDDVFGTGVATSDCPATPDVDSSVVSEADWNTQAGTGLVAIQMVATSNVDPGYCVDPTWISVRVTYTTESAAGDCNANGVPDECDIAGATSADCNTNAVPDECDIAGGTSQDLNGDGIPDECAPVAGACCYPDGSCSVTEQAACTGNWQGAGTTCSPNPCPQPQGACCFADGSCSYVTQASCAGTWQGLGTDCDPNPCPQPQGACCFADGSCTYVTQASCAGTWQGLGTDCDPNPCPQPWCLGDMNCSGGAPTFDDIKYFAVAMSGEAAWQQYYRDQNGGTDPPCPWLLGDYTLPRNGVEFTDIKPFAASIGGVCQTYVP